MKTLQNQYIEIAEGKGNKDHFLKQARHLFPELLTVNSTFKDTVKILKGKNILTEAVGGIVTQNPNKPDWFKIFNTNIKEAVGVKDKKEYGDQNTFEKIDKDVAKDLESNFDNSDPKNIDNVYGQSFLMGYLAEMDDPKNADKTVDELKKIVAKNMAQDINYYAKNGMFGVKGIGLETSKEPKAPTGKYKSSGYGNLKENLEQPKKYYAVYNIQGKYGKPLTLTANTKEEMLDRLNTIYLELTGETRAPYGMEDFEDAFYNGKKLDHFISDDWASVTDNKEVFKKDIEIFSRKEKMNENKLRSIINAIIKEELNEIGMFHDPIGYEKGSKSRREVARDILKDAGLSQEEIDTFISDNMFKKGRIDDLAKALVSKNKMNEGYGMSLEDAKAKAKHISKEEGVVQHVEETEEGSGEYRVSDWYDSDLTVVSYENGMEK